MRAKKTMCNDNLEQKAAFTAIKKKYEVTTNFYTTSAITPMLPCATLKKPTILKQQITCKFLDKEILVPIVEQMTAQQVINFCTGNSNDEHVLFVPHVGFAYDNVLVEQSALFAQQEAIIQCVPWNSVLQVCIFLFGKYNLCCSVTIELQ